MEQNENYIDMIINSLKYSISDLSALFWGGIAVLGSMLLIGLPFLFGYVIRSGREVLKGNGKLPTWDNLGEAFKDGIMIILVALFFGLISGILYVFIVPFFVVGVITGNGVLILAALFMLLPAIVISFVICLLMPAAWIQYAVTGNLLTALNPINALRMAAKNPLAYIGAVVATDHRTDRPEHPRGAGHNDPLDIVRRVHVERIHLRVVLQAGECGRPRHEDGRPGAGRCMSYRPSPFFSTCIMIIR